MKLFNFITGRKNIEIIKKSIYLTIDLSEEDNVFNNLKNFNKTNISNIETKYNYHYIEDEKIKKFEYLVREIKESKTDIIIGNAFYDLDGLKIINELLIRENLKISNIYVPSERRRVIKLAEGQELYRNHSRWIDFYPGQVEDIYEKFEENIKEIKKYFTNTEINVIEI